MNVNMQQAGRSPGQQRAPKGEDQDEPKEPHHDGGDPRKDVDGRLEGLFFPGRSVAGQVDSAADPRDERQRHGHGQQGQRAKHSQYYLQETALAQLTYKG